MTKIYFLYVFGLHPVPHSQLLKLLDFPLRKALKMSFVMLIKVTSGHPTHQWLGLIARKFNQSCGLEVPRPLRGGKVTG